MQPVTTYCVSVPYGGAFQTTDASEAAEWSRAGATVTASTAAP